MIKRKLLIMAAIVFAVASCSKDPDPVDNGDPGDLGGGNFDKWVAINQGDLSFNHPAYDWWTSLNYLAVIGGPITVTKTEDSFAGPYAAKLETKAWGSFVIPGMLASGVFDQTLPPGDNVLIGRPFSKKPKSFSGHYKYLPQGNDSFGFLVALTKYNTQTGIKDTIAIADFSSEVEKQTYTYFNVDFNYRNQLNPDSIHVIIISSASEILSQDYDGTVLYIDELELKYN